MRHITAVELAAWLADPSRESPLMLDVREPWEYEVCHIEGAMPMSMQSLPTRQQELEPESTIVCICHHGMRSAQVAAFLERNGFADVVNLTGGIHAWAQEVDRAMPSY